MSLLFREKRALPAWLERPPPAPRPACVPARGFSPAEELIIQLLAQAGESEPRIVQFVGCAPGDVSAAVPRAVAVAAALWLGRTLLLALTASGTEDADPSPVPDASVAGLFHAQLAASPAGWVGGDVRTGEGLRALQADFPVVLLDGTALGPTPWCLHLAPFCGGTVVLAAAGRSEKSRILATARGVVAAKGHVFGLVLTGPLA